MLTFLGLGSLAYAGGVWYSLRNDDFFEVFTQYVPFADYVVAQIEESELRKKYQVSHTLVTAEHPAVKSPKVADQKVTIVREGIEPREVNLEKSSQEEKASKEVPTRAKRDAVSPESVKATRMERKGATSPVNHSGSATFEGLSSPTLPLIKRSSDFDPLVSSAVDSLNKFIQSVNNSKASEDLVSEISTDLSKLSQSINAMKTAHKEELQKSLESQASKFASLGEARRLEIQTTIEAEQEKWAHEFEKEQQRLLNLYNQRLLNEVQATKRAVIAYANNRLAALNVENQKKFAEMIADKVENERDGRLGKLQNLAQAVERLEELALSSADALSETERATNFQIAVGRVANLLATSTRPVALRPYLEQIKQALPDDPLVDAALKAVPDDVYDHGVLTPAQLSARFKLLEPELHKASLLPPNAGVAGHIGSWAFSKLMMKKTGYPMGDDLESVLARAENALSEGRVTEAVAEVNSLRGWPKRLAKDWLEEGRKRSEVEFLVSVLQEAGTAWAVSKK